MSFIKARSQNFKLENMRGTFLFLLTPQKRENNGVIKFTYSGSFLWPKTVELIGKTADGKTINIQEEAARTAVEGFGDKALGLIKEKVIPNPFLDGDGPQAVSKKTGERHKGFAGHSFIRASATEKFPPDVRDDVLGADGKLVKITDQNRLKWGAYYHIVTNILAWEHPQNGKGLSFGLAAVQYAKDGEALGNGGSGGGADSFFEGVAPTADAAKAAATGAGAGGLFA
jgi:hypothetical protein